MVTYSTTRNLLLFSMILSFSPNFAHGALINYIQDNRNTVVSHLDINGNLIKETLRPSPAFSDMTGYGQYSVLGATWMNGSGTGNSFVYQEKAPTFDVTFQLTESATISMSGTLSATPQVGGGAVLNSTRVVIRQHQFIPDRRLLTQMYTLIISIR